MSLHKDPELKNAVLNLPQKEKDKLLVRLIGKDKMLLKQLHYQLLENEYDLDDRVKQLKHKLEALFHQQTTLSDAPIYSNYKNLNNLIRQASGIINEHEKVTKDKFSVAEARLYILAESFRLYPTLFGKSHFQIAEKLHRYITTRAKITLDKIANLHDDLQFDLQEDIALVQQIQQELG